MCRRHETHTPLRLASSIENVRDDALIGLGLSVGLRASEVVGVRTSEIDFERGLIKIWDEKKDKWRLTIPTLETMSALAEERVNFGNIDYGVIRTSASARIILWGPAPTMCVTPGARPTTLAPYGTIIKSTSHPT
jgi:hypothetical protein